MRLSLYSLRSARQKRRLDVTSFFLALALALQGQAPLTGMATLHNAMPVVLANYPDRACDYCDGYVAVERCEDIGRDYVLLWQGRSHLVRAADCMAAHHRPGVQARYRATYDAPWLVDIEAALWGDAPVRPLPAVLIPVEVDPWLKKFLSARSWRRW